jgi:Rieske Fe-S protein
MCARDSSDLRPDRREFLTVMAGGLLGAMLPGCAALAVSTVPVEDGALRIRLADHPDLSRPGGSARIRPQGGTDLVYVLALDDGTYAAVSPICTHQGCTVEVAGRFLECPCHGSVYTHEGTVVQGPAEAPLTRFPIEHLEDGILVIRPEGTV